MLLIKKQTFPHAATAACLLHNNNCHLSRGMDGSKNSDPLCPVPYSPFCRLARLKLWPGQAHPQRLIIQQLYKKYHAYWLLLLFKI